MGFFKKLLGRKPEPEQKIQPSTTRPPSQPAQKVSPGQNIELPQIKAHLVQFAQTGKTVEFLRE